MNCSRHPSEEVVAQCERCGAGVCSDCVQATEILRESEGVLCVDCYCSVMREMSSFLLRDAKRRLVHIIISLVFYVLGAALIIYGAVGLTTSTTFDSIVTIIAGVIMCGIYTGIAWRRVARESQEDYNSKYGAYSVGVFGVHRNTGFFIKLIYFLLGVCFGVIITPIRVIIDIKLRVDDKKSIRGFSNMIAEAQQI